MANSQRDALSEITQHICACFGSVDLNFALNHSDKDCAKRLRSITKEWGLSVSDISAAIRLPIQTWIEEGYFGFGENKPRPWSKDPAARQAQIAKMVTEASLFFVNN